MDVNCEQRETGEPDGVGGRFAGPPTGEWLQYLACTPYVVKSASGMILVSLEGIQSTLFSVAHPPPLLVSYALFPVSVDSKRMFFMEGFVSGELANSEAFRRELKELKSARPHPRAPQPLAATHRAFVERIRIDVALVVWDALLSRADDAHEF